MVITRTAGRREGRSGPYIDDIPWDSPAENPMRLSTLCLAALFALGCAESRSPTAAVETDEAKVRAALDQLSADDRALAEKQRFCAVESEHRLGSMGAPVKVTVKDQPVFLCCKGCETRALKDPDQTIQKVEELKGEGPKPE
jgi:hypothetical protein